MVKTAEKVRDAGSAVVGGVRGEIKHFVGMELEHAAAKAAEKLSEKVSGVTEQLTQVAESGGQLSAIGSRVLHGESPLKAFLSEKAKAAKDSFVERVKGVFGGGRGRKTGDTKVTNIVEFIDVGVPLRTAYDHWTRYERFGAFTKGVSSVTKSDDVTSDWRTKVGPSTRSFKATVQEQIPDDRIVWTSEGSKGATHGAVSFHELAPNLTRIALVVEYYPSGFFEKTGNLWRAQGRRLRLDFKHFQRYVTLTDEDPEGWRGEIRDGEVVRTHEEAMEEEAAEDAELDEAEEGDAEEDGAEGESEHDDEVPAADEARAADGSVRR
ncbi:MULTISPECIES: SRPBCC family protein [unclassified Streptomyces]|uniref:SRPBCC family protein n=1 Tax=unclassified Streptomyces TaxID=2593676 RepID=UPI00081DD671|nr:MULTISPECIES: SRPBCC family protein [unclassified Streptomyces]MYZ37612.1 polyketide cyclase [Streptomyces sp. SID4917]SCF92652.1 Polyketide cyclase / dehydrase and lipid transport [Streptomyces sp. MnatMP-M17]